MSRAGRAVDQLRQVKFTRDFISAADASVLVEFGKTRVICSAVEVVLAGLRQSMECCLGRRNHAWTERLQKESSQAGRRRSRD
jgi:ribonuclease PH